MRVMTHNEALAASRFENKNRFAEIDGLIRTGCQDLVDQGYIIGAFPFGSSQFNDANTSSDYDIAIAIKEEGVIKEMESYRAIHELAKSAYARTGIPIEATCYTIDQLTEGSHNLPDTTLEWLKGQAASQENTAIGYNFIPIIQRNRQPASVSMLAHIDRFVGNTRGLMKKNWLQGTCFIPHDLLGITFSTPHILGRKVVDTLQYARAVPESTLKDLTKQSIGEAVYNVFGAASEIGVLYRAISNDMTRYNDELVPQADQLSTDEYDQIIASVLDDNLPKAIELLRRMQEGCRKIYNQSASLEWAVTQPYVERSSNFTLEEPHIRMVNELRVRQMDSV